MGPELVSIVEAIRQLSTEVMVVVANYRFARFVVALTFGLDLMIILLTFLVHRFAAKHLAIRPMGERLGWRPYYTKRQLRRMERIFRRGLAQAREGEVPEGS